MHKSQPRIASTHTYMYLCYNEVTYFSASAEASFLMCLRVTDFSFLPANGDTPFLLPELVTLVGLGELGVLAGLKDLAELDNRALLFEVRVFSKCSDTLLSLCGLLTLCSSPPTVSRDKRLRAVCRVIPISTSFCKIMNDYKTCTCIIIMYVYKQASCSLFTDL